MARSRRGGASLKFAVSQLNGDSFAFYVRTPDMWNGLRIIYHTHKGDCNDSCEPNCDGYNEQAAVAVLLIKKWLDQAMPTIMLMKFDRRPLDEVVAEIAAGLVDKSKRGRRA